MNSIRCRQCEHFIIANAGEGKIYGCDRSKCVFEPTTKNNLAGDIMDFPKTFDEFANFYGFKDKDEVYTNGSELIPVFRVKQWLEHISTTKNNLGVEEVTALAEWTEKLTKECEVAYGKGYEAGMKAQEPILDKIRAEIIHETESIWNVDIIVGMKRAVDIIDKYKGKSEET